MKLFRSHSDFCYFLPWGVKLGRLRLFCFLIYALIAICIPLRTAFTASHRFWYVSRCFTFLWISSLTNWLFRSMFNLHMFVDFPTFLLLISSFIPLWSEEILSVVYIFLNLLRRVLCPIICCGVLEKNVYSASVRWTGLFISVRSIWTNIWFKSSVSLLILSGWGGIKVPCSLLYCLFLPDLLSRIVEFIFLMNWPLYILTFFVSRYHFWIKDYFVYIYLHFHGISCSIFSVWAYICS